MVLYEGHRCDKHSINTTIILVTLTVYIADSIAVHVLSIL